MILPLSTTATRSQSRSASSMKCVTRTTVVPRSRICSMRSQATRRAAGSRPVVISSRKTTSGELTSARAMNSRWRCPPERLEKEAFRFSARPHCSSSVCQSTAPGREAGEEVERLPHLEVVGEARLLQLAAHAPAQVAGVRARVLAEHAHRAGGRRAQALDALDGGRLAGAVRARAGRRSRPAPPRTRCRRRRPRDGRRPCAGVPR